MEVEKQADYIEGILFATRPPVAVASWFQTMQRLIPADPFLVGLFTFYLCSSPIPTHSFFAEDRFSGGQILPRLNLPPRKLAPPLATTP